MFSKEKVIVYNAAAKNELNFEDLHWLITAVKRRPAKTPSTD